MVLELTKRQGFVPIDFAKGLLSVTLPHENNVGTYGSKCRIKRPGEEKSVDWEKPENGWGAVGEQLLPNKADLARKRGFHPP